MNDPQSDDNETLNQPFGDYVLERRLGEGGMAVTFVARESMSGMAERHVCIKQILPQFAADPKFREMFHDEVRVTSILSHRNVCRIYRAGEVGDSLYMAMEYIDGLAVDDLVAIAAGRGHFVPVEHALHLTAEVMEGLHAAHTQVDTQGQPLNLVHRDVSPQNVLISRKGDVKVIDFGVAKAASNMSKTRTGAVKGKLLYLSPEQLQGKTLDGRSDVFSAGLMLYQLLTGTHPFEGPDEHATIYNYISRDIEPPSQVASHVPALVDAPVMRALAKDRDERFETAADFSRALTDALYAVVPSYRPYRFAEFVEWALDPNAGPSPSPASAILTGPGLADPGATGAGPAVGDWDGEDGFAPTVQTGAIPVSPEFRDHAAIAMSGGTDSGAAPRPSATSSPSIPSEPAPSADGAASSPAGDAPTRSKTPLLIGAAVVVFLIIVGIVAWQMSGSDDPELDASASDESGDGGDESDAGDEPLAATGEGESTGTASDDPDATPGTAGSDDAPPGVDDPPTDDDGTDESGDEGADDPTTDAPETDGEVLGAATDETDETDEADEDIGDGSWGSDDESESDRDESDPDENVDDGGTGGWGTTDSAADTNTGGWGTTDAPDESPWVEPQTSFSAMSMEDFENLELPKDQEQSLGMVGAVMGARGTRVLTYLRLNFYLGQNPSSYMPAMQRFCELVRTDGWTSREEDVLDEHFGGVDPCSAF